MAFRSCECVLRLSDGKTYVATVAARSVYQAAMAFKEYCEDPKFPHRPRLTPESRIDVKPIYTVEMSKVFAYADWFDSRARARQQR